MDNRTHSGRTQFAFGVLTTLLLLTLCAALPGYSQGAPDLLSQQVLVVYNTNFPESLDVANYYRAQRGIPAGNLCPISPRDPESVGSAEYESTVRIPIQNCLNAVGANNILYIVFSYLTPFVLWADIGYVYSLDQFVADIWNAYSAEVFYPFPDYAHSYYADAQTQGNVYEPFLSLADYRSQPDAQTIYSVWRLDAANPDLATGLVDKAISAEADGLAGQGCFDMREYPVGAFDASYDSGDYDIFEAADFAGQAGFQVTPDYNEEEFGTPPAPLRCDNTALYAGWYSLDHYNDAFTWNPGAIGFHIDSASAANPRSGPNWSANALMRGLTVTSGSVNEPYLEGLAHVDGVYRNLFEGANVGDAVLRNTPWLRWMILNIGDPLYRPFPDGFPAFDPNLNPQSSLALAPREQIAGEPVTGTITLARPASPGGSLVTLSSSDPTVAAVPDSVTVPEGARSAVFQIATAVPLDIPWVHITATFSDGSRTNTLTVWPLELDSLYLPPSDLIVGGQQGVGKVYLTGAVPEGSFTVYLSSDNPDVASVPASLTIPSGADHASFTITTTQVTYPADVTITATDGDVMTSEHLLVYPADALTIGGVRSQAVPARPAKPRQGPRLLLQRRSAGNKH